MGLCNAERTLNTFPLFPDELKTKLEKYLERFPKVKILRLPFRSGVIRTRMLGAVNAKSPVLVFLDSHVEVMYGWLEPVLERFLHNRKLLVTMWYLTLDRETLEFDVDGVEQPTRLGGFFWNLDFAFINREYYEENHTIPLFDARPTPTIFGSMHAIRKDYFIEIGMYDTGFDMWGGEDVE